ncbi:PINIT domain-containing protein [Mucidula mucida]|nr:PINIT domain-containing protein [Mucidula mucida]
MASTDPWFEFELIRHNVKYNTVDRLKQMLIGLNDECGVYLPKTGKKQEIIDRILSTLDAWKQQNQTDKWAKARTIIQQVRSHGQYTPARTASTSAAASSSGPASGAHAMHNTYNGAPAYPYGNGVAPRYDTYAPARKPSGSLNQLPSSSHSAPSKLAAGKPGLRFKESPFLSIEQAVSSVVECPESNSSTDRRQQTVVFTLTNDQLAKLKSASPKYQLRLFCTSSTFYSPNPTFRSTTSPALVEFPPTCEVRVNNVQLSVNLKGLKKKPGTAPPPDLGKYIRLNTTSNKVEMVYVNSQTPVQSKKFYLVVHLVRTTSVDHLVNQLKQTSYTTAADIKARMKASINDDDDIIAGPQKMSLKCPLSFMRVATPCRSSKCVHPQCFDATSWFSVMEQTTTWLCPVCERVLDTKDLIIDGYFDEIVKSCPESVEDVFVEADGEWHTTDNKYGSAEWKAQHPPVKPATAPRKPVSRTRTPPSQCNGKTNGKGKADLSILILDSDDEEENRVKRELSPSFGNASSSSLAPSLPPRSQSVQDTVIDLTLDSDEEEDVAPPRHVGKRKASDAPSPTEPIWKKSRPIIPVESDRAGGSSSALSARNSDYPPARPAIDAPAVRYTMHSNANPPGPLYPTAGVNTTYANGYPEPEGLWSSRVNGNTRW